MGSYHSPSIRGHHVGKFRKGYAATLSSAGWLGPDATLGSHNATLQYGPQTHAVQLVLLLVVTLPMITK